jgi:hypothetical protein
MGSFESVDDLFDARLCFERGGWLPTRRSHFGFTAKYVSKNRVIKGGNQMDATALTTAKQNIRQLKKQKAEILSAAPDQKKLKKIQRQVKLLKRQSRALAREKKLAAAKAAADTAAKEAAEKAAAAAAKKAEAAAAAG